MEVIYKREDGSRVKCSVNIVYGNQNYKMYVSVYVCPPNKRKFVCIIDRNAWEYRRLSVEDRIAYVKAKTLEYVSLEEIDNVKQKLIAELGKTLPYDFGF